MRRGRADEPVAAVAPGVVDGHHLQVLGERVVDLPVARHDLPLQLLRVEQRLLGELVHARHQLGQGVGDDEVLPPVEERLHRRRRAGTHAAQHLRDAAAGQVGVLLGPRERELLLGDLVGEHEPRVVVAGRGDRAQRGERVEAGERGGGEAAPARVEPQRRRAGQDPDAVPRPDRVPVVDALGVVPHPVAVHEASACGFADAEHAPVDVLGHAGDQVLRRGAEAGGPMLPNEVVVGADPAAGDDHGLRPELEPADLDPRARRAARGGGRLQHGTAHPGDHAVGEDQLVHAAAELELHPARGDRRPHPPFERLHDCRPGAPRDVEAGHRVAVAVGEVAAALGPADDREEPHTHPGQPRPLLACREVDVRRGPLAAPEVLARGVVGAAVEARRAEPVLQGEVGGVADAEAALLGGVDEEQPAERPERLPAEARRGLLVEQDHPPARVRQLGGGHQPGEPGPHDDDVCVHVHHPGTAAPAAGRDAVPAGAARRTWHGCARGGLDAVPAGGRGGTPGTAAPAAGRIPAGGAARRRGNGAARSAHLSCPAAAPQQGGEVDAASGKIAARGTWRPWRGPPCAVRGDLPRGGPCGRRPGPGVRAWSGGPRPGRGGRPGPPAPAWACGRGSR